MKSVKETKIIGIDHGYGNMKTANHCFKTGISTYGSEPLFTADMLTFNGKYYLIGEGHKEFAPDKVKDEDYYLIVDGFHRYRIMIEHPDIYEREKGMLPVSVINKSLDQRMASTIRHNRARGSHDVDLMSNIVKELHEC